MADAAVAVSSATPPTLRAKLLTAARALQYESSHNHSIESEELAALPEEWVTYDPEADLGVVWDQYDDHEEAYWAGNDTRLQHGRVRRRGDWKLDAAGLYKNRTKRSVVKAQRRRQNRSAVQSTRRTAGNDSSDYWATRLARQAAPTQISPPQPTRVHRVAMMARETPAVQAHALRDPVSQRQALLEQLQYRDITPEDYQLLLELDEEIQAKTVCKDVVSKLPRVQACEDHTTEACAICMDLPEIKATLVVLPCEHVFHEACIETWLKQFGHTCPLDQQAIA
eukprot:m.27020 g.27020  ORF g.27020 m.27020 type:complete len:282 (+) comp11741_c0_seq1:72-917(+)